MVDDEAAESRLRLLISRAERSEILVRKSCYPHIKKTLPNGESFFDIRVMVDAEAAESRLRLSISQAERSEILVRKSCYLELESLTED